MLKKIAVGILLTWLLCLAACVAMADDGTKKWDFPNVVPGCTAIGPEGVLYIGGSAQNSYGLLEDALLAVAQDGSKKWECPVSVSMQLSSFAIGADGTIYARGESYGDGLCAIAPDGTSKWSFPLGSRRVSSTPAIAADGTIYVGGNDGKLYALNPDGSEKWDFQTEYAQDMYSGVGDPVIGADGTIYVGGHDGKLYAIDPNGSKKWDFPNFGVGGYRISPAIGADGTLYGGGYDGKLYAIDSSGNEKWEFSISDSTCAPVIGGAGIIYVGGNGNLYAIYPDGKQKWELALGGDTATCPAIGADGTIYLATTQSSDGNGSSGSLTNSPTWGTLYAINPDGTKKWEFRADTSFRYAPAIGGDGTVYVVSNSTMYAINTTCGGLARGAWPKFHRDAKNTGRTPSFTNVLDFLDSSVTRGLFPDADFPFRAYQERLLVLRNLILRASAFQEAGYYDLASRQLLLAYKKIDGSPRDFLKGPAASELADMIMGLQATLDSR